MTFDEMVKSLEYLISLEDMIIGHISGSSTTLSHDQDFKDLVEEYINVVHEYTDALNDEIEWLEENQEGAE